MGDAETKVTRGSGNVFADLGVPRPEEALLKARLASLIHDAIDAAGWTQGEAAERLGLKQPEVSQLTRGRLNGFSLERLMRLLTRLNHDVTLTIQPPGGEAPEVHLLWNAGD